jgi:carboxypeptidase family protein
MSKHCCFAFGVLLSLNAAFAQSEVATATLTGTITDPSGAAIANAKVTALNSATGFNRSVQTADTGLYVFSRMPVGAYNISVDAAGFKAMKRTGLS